MLYDEFRTILFNNGGVITTKEALQLKCSKTYFLKFVKDEGLIKYARGIYYQKSKQLNELYLIQLRFPKIVYSHETSISLLRKEKVTTKVCTIPSGYFSQELIDNDFKLYYLDKDIMDLGVTNYTFSNGQVIKIYCLEMSICLLLRNRTKYDKKYYNTLIRDYLTKNEDTALILYYAKLLSVDKVLNTYLDFFL